MKRILIFSLAYHPFVGGAEIAIKEITDRISPEDIEFHLVTLRMRRDLPRTEKVGNVRIFRIGSGKGPVAKFLFQFFAAHAGLLLHRRYSYGAVWAMMAHSSGVPGALFKWRRPDVPYILTLQEGDPPEHIERVMLPLWPLFSRAFTKADIVQAISIFLGQWARRRGFAGPLEIIPNGVDVKKFSGAPAAHAGAVLITSSRLVHKNAVDEIIRALALLPEVRLKIAGIGPEENRLRSLARELGVESRVEWLGFVDHAALPALLHAADVFVRPSRTEGMGNSFIEAMAAGVPVVATQEGGLKDFITGEVAWPVPKDSPEHIAKAVRQILRNPEQARQVVEKAKTLAFEHYDWDLVAKEMRERVFGRALKNG